MTQHHEALRAIDPARARKDAIEVVRTLRAAGHTAAFAGGCVRDELLGLAPTDFDIATDATPQRVASLFPRTAEVGAAFGVVLVHTANSTIEVATFRADGPYSDSRRPDHVHFSDPASDAARRDFTINALFLSPVLDPTPSTPPAPLPAFVNAAGIQPVITPRVDLAGTLVGHVIDYVGGTADLHSRVIRAVGNADQRLAEDHLRALRAVRFSARLGFTIDPATADAIRRHASELRGVSRERIGDEMRKLLGHPSTAARSRAIELLYELRLDAPVLNKTDAASALASPSPADAAALLRALPPLDYPACLAAWAIAHANAEALPEHPFGTRLGPDSLFVRTLVGRWREALNLSNDERRDLADTLEAFVSIQANWDSLGVAGRKRLASRPRFGPALALVGALHHDRAKFVHEQVSTLAATPSGLAPEPLLTGDRLIAAGFAPGPQFRRLLELTYDAQLEDRVSTPAAALELAKAAARL